VERKIYVIMAKPGSRPSIYLMGPDGVPRPSDPTAALPPSVSEYAAWLSALADKRPLPAGKPPPVVIAPSRPGEAFVTLISVEQDNAT
jgi:hypothetical protein